MPRAESEPIRPPEGEAAGGSAFHPRPGLVHVWRVDLRTDPEATDLELLDAAERERLERYRVPRDRRRFAARRIALRRLLGATVGADPASLRFETRCRHCGHPSHGKPRLAGSQPVAFTVARAGDLALVAVADGGELGIDVEEAGRPLSIRDLEPVLSARELSWQAESRGVRGSLHRLWTRKEALGKAIGVGLVGEASTLDTCAWQPARLVEEGPARARGAPAAGTRLVPDSGASDTRADREWWIYDLPSSAGHVAALAADRPIEEVVLLDAGCLDHPRPEAKRYTAH